MRKNLSLIIVLVLIVLAGALYVNGYWSAKDLQPASPAGRPVAEAKCHVGGCSGQICSDQEGLASTCEFRAEYACYQSAKCERQTDGECGWTPTAELNSCLANPPQL